MTEILLILKALSEGVAFLTGLAATLQAEGRDPTAAELADAKAKQKAAEDAWAALLPKS
jgi:hypothetical protein